MAIQSIKHGSQCGAGRNHIINNYRKTSIYAGSNEIQHNIMAKMVLGL